MTAPRKIKASPEPPLPAHTNLHGADTHIDKPAGNGSQPLEKLRVRHEAGEDQATLQDKGADALPVSDYPLKTGPLAANKQDLRQSGRARYPRRPRG